MSMTFTKLFSSITASTIWAEPDHTRLVWITMLAMADKHGRVWASIPGLANMARVTLERCEDALNALKSPDKYSRTRDFDGRRIEDIDGGWRLLNHAKYRAIRDEESIKESKRNHINNKRAAARVEAAFDSRTESNAVDRGRHNAEADTEADSLPTSNDVGSTHGRLSCPHDRILDLWGEVLPTLPQHEKRLWKGARANHLRTRWREEAQAKHWVTADDGIEYFRKLFAYVGQSKFLTGRARSGDRQPFQAELAWLVKPENWVKTLEGKYHADQV